MRARILIALSAWLVGAATATGGWLMAVSLLGDGFGLSRSSSQTVAVVQKALAASSQEQSPTPSRSARAGAAPTRPRAARPTPTPSPTQSDTVLTSDAGTVIATCESAGVYLRSWSPAQGYGVEHVVQGPAAEARVTFDAGTRTVTMHVSCFGGTPFSTTSTDNRDGGSGDDRGR